MKAAYSVKARAEPLRSGGKSKPNSQVAMKPTTTSQTSAPNSTTALVVTSNEHGDTGNEDLQRPEDRVTVDVSGLRWHTPSEYQAILNHRAHVERVQSQRAKEAVHAKSRMSAKQAKDVEDEEESKQLMLELIEKRKERRRQLAALAKGGGLSPQPQEEDRERRERAATSFSTTRPASRATVTNSRPPTQQATLDRVRTPTPMTGQKRVSSSSERPSTSAAPVPLPFQTDPKRPLSREFNGAKCFLPQRLTPATPVLESTPSVSSPPPPMAGAKTVDSTVRVSTADGPGNRPGTQSLQVRQKTAETPAEKSQPAGLGALSEEENFPPPPPAAGIRRRPPDPSRQTSSMHATEKTSKKSTPASSATSGTIAEVPTPDQDGGISDNRGNQVKSDSFHHSSESESSCSDEEGSSSYLDDDEGSSMSEDDAEYGIYQDNEDTPPEQYTGQSANQGGVGTKAESAPAKPKSEEMVRWMISMQQSLEDRDRELLSLLREEDFAGELESEDERLHPGRSSSTPGRQQQRGKESSPKTSEPKSFALMLAALRPNAISGLLKVESVERRKLVTQQQERLAKIFTKARQDKIVVARMERYWSHALEEAELQEDLRRERIEDQETYQLSLIVQRIQKESQREGLDDITLSCIDFSRSLSTMAPASPAASGSRMPLVTTTGISPPRTSGVLAGADASMTLALASSAENAMNDRARTKYRNQRNILLRFRGEAKRFAGKVGAALLTRDAKPNAEAVFRDKHPFLDASDVGGFTAPHTSYFTGYLQDDESRNKGKERKKSFWEKEEEAKRRHSRDKSPAGRSAISSRRLPSLTSQQQAISFKTRLSVTAESFLPRFSTGTAGSGSDPDRRESELSQSGPRKGGGSPNRTRQSSNADSKASTTSGPDGSRPAVHNAEGDVAPLQDTSRAAVNDDGEAENDSAHPQTREETNAAGDFDGAPTPTILQDRDVTPIGAEGEDGAHPSRAHQYPKQPPRFAESPVDSLQSTVNSLSPAASNATPQGTETRREKAHRMWGDNQTSPSHPSAFRFGDVEERRQQRSETAVLDSAGEDNAEFSATIYSHIADPDIDHVHRAGANQRRRSTHQLGLPNARRSSSGPENHNEDEGAAADSHSHPSPQDPPSPGDLSKLVRRRSTVQSLQHAVGLPPATLTRSDSMRSLPQQQDPGSAGASPNHSRRGSTIASSTRRSSARSSMDLGSTYGSVNLTQSPRNGGARNHGAHNAMKRTESKRKIPKPSADIEPDAPHQPTVQELYVQKSLLELAQRRAELGSQSRNRSLTTPPDGSEALGETSRSVFGDIVSPTRSAGSGTRTSLLDAAGGRHSGSRSYSELALSAGPLIPLQNEHGSPPKMVDSAPTTGSRSVGGPTHSSQAPQCGDPEVQNESNSYDDDLGESAPAQRHDNPISDPRHGATHATTPLSKHASNVSSVLRDSATEEQLGGTVSAERKRKARFFDEVADSDQVQAKTRVSISAMYHNIPGYSHQSSPFLPFSRRQSDDLTSLNELERLLHKLQHLGEPSEEPRSGSPALSGRRSEQTVPTLRRRSSSVAQEATAKPGKVRSETKRNSAAGPLTASFRKWSSYHSLTGRSNAKYPFGSPSRYRSHDSSSEGEDTEDDEDGDESEDETDHPFGSGGPYSSLATLPQSSTGADQKKTFKESKLWALTELDMYLYRPPPASIV